MTEFPEPWPLRHLVLRTPRLELRPDDDAGLHELAALACRGVHPPELMPFLFPWTDLPPAELVRSVMQYHWRQRAACTTQHWAVSFLARLDGVVVGTQELNAQDFAVTRSVGSGSWLGRQYQGAGLGTEMRAAVLLFAFDHLGATEANSDAFDDNPASMGVSRKLGYRTNGVVTLARRERPASNFRLRLLADQFVRPEWTLGVSGVEGCLAEFC